MPRYYFYVHDGVNQPDIEGTELLDLKEAHEEAFRYAGRIISDAARKLKLGEDWVMQVTDERGSILFRIDFTGSSAAAKGEVPTANRT